MGKLAQQKSGVNNLNGSKDKRTKPYIEDVNVVINKGAASETMRAGYERFWQLLLGRILLDKSPDP